MEYRNAFVGTAKQPGSADVAAALGPASGPWDEFVDWMAKEEGVATQEWKGICVNKYGWSLRLKQKGKNIVYLGPGNGCFMASFVFNDKALAAAKAAHLNKTVDRVLDEAPRYPEGNGVRLVVTKEADLAAIRKLAHIKLTKS